MEYKELKEGDQMLDVFDVSAEWENCHISKREDANCIDNEGLYYYSYRRPINKKNKIG